MIFRRYYVTCWYWLHFRARMRRRQWWDKNPAVCAAAEAEIQKTEPDVHVSAVGKWRYEPAKWWSFFWKPVGGGCVYCQSIWLGSGLYAALFYAGGWPALLWWAPYCGAVYLFVALLEKPLSPHQ